MACHGPTQVGRPGVRPGRAGPSILDKIGRGPARQNFRGWAAARPGPSKLPRIGRGPAQPITFSKIHGPARPFFFFGLGPARPGPIHDSEAHQTRALYEPARQLCRPFRGFDRLAHGPARVLSRTKDACAYADVTFFKVIVGCSLFFSPSGFRGTAAFGK